MAFYDVFLNQRHTDAEQHLMLSLNRSLLRFLLRAARDRPTTRILEVGPGKGYFHAACRELADRVAYTAVDRSPTILEALGAEGILVSDAADLPDLGKKYDVIYAGFVVEHFASGKAVYDFLSRCRVNLAPTGIVALAAPDCMKMGFEFWNIDYTHAYPTTKRNLTMALAEAGFERPRIVDVNGLLTLPGFEHRAVYLALRGLVKLYGYEVPALAARPFYRTPLHDLRNIFYRLYCLAKEENMIAVARVDEGRARGGEAPVALTRSSTAAGE